MSINSLLQEVIAFIEEIPPSTKIALGISLLVITLAFIISKIKPTNSNSGSNDDISVGLQREQRSTSSNALNDLKPLNPSVFKPFKLVSVVQVSHNTKSLKFEVPGDQARLLTCNF